MRAIPNSLLAAAVAVVSVAGCSIQSEQRESQPALPGLSGNTENRVENASPSMMAMTAPWCPSCKIMEPLIRELKEHCSPEGVTVQNLDVSMEENESMAKRYAVQAVPTFLFFDKKGNLTEKLIGEQSKEKLMQALAFAKGEPCRGLTRL